MVYYIIATGRYELDGLVTQEYWNADIREWDVLWQATVYTDSDRNSGVNLPRGGYWLKIDRAGVSRPGES
jgi:hypothetical protein